MSRGRTAPAGGHRIGVFRVVASGSCVAPPLTAVGRWADADPLDDHRLGDAYIPQGADMVLLLSGQLVVSVHVPPRLARIEVALDYTS